MIRSSLLSGRVLLIGLLTLGLASGVGRADVAVSADARFLAALTARPIGPAAMSGRIVDVAVVENKPAVMYVASASGGLWKTVNNGTTWKPVFEREATVSLGAVAVAPSDPEIVWVGTGEANARNSVSWGDGVYRSINGGRTWTHMGLSESAHVGRIVIHPKNPRIVYVAALGHLWGANQERGLFKTTDGGRTWRCVKFVNEDTGFIDVVMDPKDPSILYAAAYQVRRGPFAGGNPAVQTGPGSGLFKSTDGGETWFALRQGLPRRPLGRCGLAVSRKDPRYVYAVVQTDLTSTTVSGQAAKTNSEPDNGGVFRSEDRGETWTKLNDLCPRPFYYGQIRVDPTDGRRVYVLGLALHVSTDGGRTFQNTGAPGIHADHHALWIDPRDPDHLVLGGDGGLHFSYDRGRAWEHLTNLPVSQFYAVAVDLRKPYRIYGGLQDNGTWCGPSATPSPDGIGNADWFRVLDADGFQCQADPARPNLVFAESQWGGLCRIDLRTGAQTAIRPQPTQGEPAYRFNWNSPILLSSHSPRALYFGGNHVFRSRNDGDGWEVISPDLTRGQPGPSADSGHTITTLAESPRKAGVLYAGTDDGLLWVSRDGGATWTDRSDRLPKLPAARWVSRVECSHFAEGTAYVAIDRHRQDDRAPYLFKTDDYGATWRPLTGDLPAKGPVYVVRESSRNPNLLLVGTELGLYATLDGGGHWHRLRALPTVAVHDLVIHPRDRDLVIATHGRGIYVMDLAPLEDLTPAVLAADAYLFEPKPAVVLPHRRTRMPRGAKPFLAANPRAEAVVHYYLRESLTAPVLVTIQDALGRTVVNLTGGKGAGLHRVVWSLRPPLNADGETEGAAVAAGEYTVRLKAGNQVLSRMVRVEED
jgi:photosystem II stability/assembly factor-like uncharacterized protein